MFKVTILKIYILSKAYLYGCSRTSEPSLVIQLMIVVVTYHLRIYAIPVEQIHSGLQGNMSHQRRTHPGSIIEADVSELNVLHRIVNGSQYTNQCFNSGNYSLWTVEEMTDGACYTVDVPDGGEVIFEIYGGQTNSYDPGLEGLWSLTAGSYGDAGCAQDIRNLIGSDPDDVRNDLFVNDSKGVNASVWHTAKYAGKGIGSNVDYTNVIVLRLAEMYLNRAEALSNGARIDGRTADMDLQTLAENRGTTAPSSTPDGIFTERQKELNWEGHLWFDLGRQGRSMTRTDVANSAIPSEIAFPGDLWAMPIPESEIEVNPNLEQNPGF